MTDIYTTALDTLKDSLVEQLSLVEQPTVDALFTLVTEWRTNFRFYYLSSASATAYMWEPLRNKPVLLDTVMNITSDWVCRVNSKLEDHEVSMLARILATSVTALTNTRSKVTDDTFREKISNTDDIADLLLSEAWLVVCMLLSRHLNDMYQIVTETRS